MRSVMMLVVFTVLGVVAMTNQIPVSVGQPLTNSVKTVKEPLARVRCESVTKSGNRCSRKAAPGEKFCRQHLRVMSRGSK